MHWLLTLDTALFRWINLNLSNPVLDVVMPFVSGNAFFYPVLVLVGILVVWKGRTRGIVCAAMLVLVLAIGDGQICRNMKRAIGRPRPFQALADVRSPGYTPPPSTNAPAVDMPQTAAAAVGAPKKGPSGSMPSSHAANWFSAAMVAFIYYRRSLWFMLPGALLVSFSRLYNGVHYPSDVLVGAILGAGYGAAIVWSLDALWRWAGRKWFPLWWARLPSLMDPVVGPEPDEEEAAPVPPPRRGQAPADFEAPHTSLDAHWLHLGYVLVGFLLLARWAYLASGTLQLSEDEAYQWVWSKHPALSYFSKPPLIAYTQFLGTSLWGDTEFGIRFLSPLITAILSVLALRFFAREVNARAGFFLLLITTATPLLSLGSVLMTVDPLSVLFWTAAMLAGWRAVQANAATGDWLWVGLWMGLGFLSKYTALLQWLCWAVFFILYPPARRQLRRPGPYLALLVNLLCTIPVLVWNYQHGWITVAHVGFNAGLGKAWEPTLRYMGDFVGMEFGLLNPVFFVAMVWAAIGMWRRARHNPRLIYCFSMGAPLFLAYFFYSLRSRLLANWIAPSVLPLFFVMVIYWDTRWRLGARRIRGWLITGLVLGFAATLIGHNTDLTKKLTGYYLPVNLDPLHRVRVWSDVAHTVSQARNQLLEEGKPVFIVGNHYGMVSLLTFYMPEAKAKVSDTPLVYFRSSPKPVNQYFFWPSYGERKGENALFVNELSRSDPTPKAPPAWLVDQFESVTDLGVVPVKYHNQVCRPLQLFACRGLK